MTPILEKEHEKMNENHITSSSLLKKLNLVRENVKSLSNSVIKFCDQRICEEFHFFRH
ncbi:hypothetical protein MTR_2g089020 [Medicago truncatula]|uniref:Uncharacterized protein n=1 Tax=Medicago truncatula TaxID=3880 RepID=G7IKM5_MEDTR|nr:hypothetical protein MTR_2g089020 [Medicago truncatula]